MFRKSSENRLSTLASDDVTKWHIGIGRRMQYALDGGFEEASIGEELRGGCRRAARTQDTAAQSEPQGPDPVRFPAWVEAERRTRCRGHGLRPCPSKRAKRPVHGARRCLVYPTSHAGRYRSRALVRVATRSTLPRGFSPDHVAAFPQTGPREARVVREAGGPRPVVQLPTQLLEEVLEVVVGGRPAQGGRHNAFTAFDLFPPGGNDITQRQNLTPVGLVGVELEDSGPDRARGWYEELMGWVGRRSPFPFLRGGVLGRSAGSFGDEVPSARQGRCVASELLRCVNPLSHPPTL